MCAFESVGSPISVQSVFDYSCRILNICREWHGMFYAFWQALECVRALHCKRLEPSSIPTSATLLIFNAKPLHIQKAAKMHTEIPCHTTYIQYVCNLATLSIKYRAYSCHTLLIFSMRNQYTFQSLPKCIKHQLVSYAILRHLQCSSIPSDATQFWYF